MEKSRRSEKRLSFEVDDPGHSSASDEDQNRVEVTFDPSNPYRRKSSLVTNETIPPYLRAHGGATSNSVEAGSGDSECFVHQFLENFRRPSRHHYVHAHLAAAAGDGPYDEDDAKEEHGCEDEVNQGHGNKVGGYYHKHQHRLQPHRVTRRRHESSSVKAEDISDESGLDRIVDPKGSDAQVASKEDDDNKSDSIIHAKRRCTILDGDSSNPEDADSNVGQTDEQEWRAEIVRPTPRSVSENTSSAAASSDSSDVHPDVARSLESIEETTGHDQNPHDQQGNLNPGQYNAKSSRLLTKKQLSEMAWGVRELSRRLGTLRMKIQVRTVFLLTKVYDRDLVPKTRALAAWLLHPGRDVRYTVYIDRELKENPLFDAPGLLLEVQEAYRENGTGLEEKGLSKRLRYWNEDMCRTRPNMFDFVITLGGDGTVLYASWLFQRIVPPVLSFALGSLGFLTKFDFEDYEETLDAAFNGGVSVSLRLRFEGTVMRSQPKKKYRGKQQRLITDGTEVGAEEEEEIDEDEEDRDGEAKLKASIHEKYRDLVEELIGEEKDDERTHRPDGTYEVLNEVVVDRGPNPTLSTIEVFGDDEHFTSVLADGICVSTPTGSTAYNLAAGGSLCHPENPVMLVTAVCAHTLSFRPIILPDTIVLRIGVPYDARTSSWASFDGRERIELKPGDYVTVSASRYPFASVQPPKLRRSEDWINSISAKLGWNTRQKQKAFN